MFGLLKLKCHLIANNLFDKQTKGVYNVSMDKKSY